jgi:hypothetical protein
MSQLFCQCYASSVHWTVRAHCPRPPIRARTSCPCPNFVRALTSVSKDLIRSQAVCGSRPSCPRPNFIRALTSASKDLSRSQAVCGSRPSCPRSCLFPPILAIVPVRARSASVDSHLRLPTATLAGNSKKHYNGKVNLEQ